MDIQIPIEVKDVNLYTRLAMPPAATSPTAGAIVIVIVVVPARPV
jgi:hypothetical protein